jgi:chaperone BCS1
MLSKALHQVKTQVTSSVTLGPNDGALKDGLLRFIRNNTMSTSKSWLSFRGRHEQRNIAGELQPLPGEIKQAFWFDESLFVLDEPESGINSDEDWNQYGSSRSDVTYHAMIIRCFGHSNEPILKLLEQIKMEELKSEKLRVRKIMSGATLHDDRDKRPLSSIDLEPKMLSQIRQEVDDFFHPGSRKLYKDTGRPYRHGFLLMGPPGSGKTSLSVAIASHVSVPLVIINLQGMDDKDLEAAFSSAPLPCVILLEDIDACAADVGRRAPLVQTRQKHSGKKHEQIEQGDAAKLIEQALSEITRQQKAEMEQFRQEVLSLLQKSENHDRYEEAGNEESWSQPTQPLSKPKKIVSTPKRVTLSGLLNVIDGASALENRLLIMTTNHPEKLDPALTRAGRCDSKFLIGYSTKETAEQTFKRIFGADTCKRHQSEAIDRFAQAFKQQFPGNSKISTCELARYCGMYRNRPVEAVQDFSKWLQNGEEIFAYTIDSQDNNAGDEKFNEPETFDSALLEVGPQDFIKAVPEAVLVEEAKVVKRSILNPMRWLSGNIATVEVQSSTSPVAAKPNALHQCSSAHCVDDPDCDCADNNFKVDDVEYDEWPEFSLFEGFVKNSHLAKQAKQASLRLEASSAQDAEWPTFDLI